MLDFLANNNAPALLEAESEAVQDWIQKLLKAEAVLLLTHFRSSDLNLRNDC